jgi:hypothetical protein
MSQLTKLYSSCSSTIGVLSSSANSSWIRRYRSSNFGCQSPLSDSIQSSEPSVWPTGHRPMSTRGRAVATVRRPWPHQSGREVFKGATTPPSLSLVPCPFSLSLSPRSSGETKPPLPPLLRRAHARSPPQHCPPNLVCCSTLNPSYLLHLVVESIM